METGDTKALKNGCDLVRKENTITSYNALCVMELQNGLDYVYGERTYGGDKARAATASFEVAEFLCEGIITRPLEACEERLSRLDTEPSGIIKVKLALVHRLS